MKKENWGINYMDTVKKNSFKYYYRLNGLGIDNFDKKQVLKYNEELNNFEDLAEALERLEQSYEKVTKERADIMVCVLPEDAETYTDGVVEVTAYHKTKNKPFFGKRTENIFSLNIVKTTSTEIELYFYETTNFSEVQRIFYDYIVNQKIPTLYGWDKEVISYE